MGMETRANLTQGRIERLEEIGLQEWNGRSWLFKDNLNIMFMARDLEYDNISPEAYAVFKSYIENRMELGYFSNACTVRNAMDRARMNTTIRTFWNARYSGL